MTQLHNKPQRNKRKLKYPDTDGKPMAENTLQARYMTLINGGLDDMFSHDPNALIAIDLFWYPVEGNPKLRLAPDLLVALGRPKGERMSYMQWEEDNTPPQVIFEIWSPGNRAKEKEAKFSFYETYGVKEYYTYDPLKGELAGWLRNDKEKLLPIANMQHWRSPLLGISFELVGVELRLYRPDGQVFVSYAIMADRARQFEQQALHEQAAREQAEAAAADALQLRNQAQQRQAQAEAAAADALQLRNQAQQRQMQAEQREKLAQTLAEQERLAKEQERLAKEKAWAKLVELGVDPNSLS